ncbi:MAG TPA: CCA tRNA nucleotidyltransferase [Gemmatimonadales bacterium]
MDLPAEVVEIAATLEAAGYETWAVGGALRDVLLGEGQSDVDLATAAAPEVVQRLFPHTVPVGIRHGTVGVLDRRRHLHEVTTFRRDVETDGRHAVVSFGASLDEDLARRDFTINAIAYHPIRQEWRDRFGGREDLQAGVVRAVGVARDRFREDYLRILRAIRFAARFGFVIEPETWVAAQENAGGLQWLSAERVRDEWFKGLRTARDLAAFCRLWREVGAAAIWLPELAGDFPGADHAPAWRDPVVLTALTCRDPATVLERLRASRAEVARAAALAAGPRAPERPEPEAVRRWLAAVGAAADDLLLLERYHTADDPGWEGLVADIRSRGEATARGDLAVTGTDLLEAGWPAGPALGALLDRLLDAVLADPALNTRDRLLALAESWR